MLNPFDEQTTRAVIEARRELLMRDGGAMPRTESGADGSNHRAALRQRAGWYVVRLGRWISGPESGNYPCLPAPRRDGFDTAGAWR
jgi:hypothetical protein